MEWTICTDPGRTGVTLTDNGSVIASVTTPSSGLVNLDSARGVYEVMAFGRSFPNELNELDGMAAAVRIVRDILLYTAKRVDETPLIEFQLERKTYHYDLAKEYKVRIDSVMDFNDIADFLDKTKKNSPELFAPGNSGHALANSLLAHIGSNFDGVLLSGKEAGLLTKIVISHFSPEGENHLTMAHAVVAGLQQHQNVENRVNNIRKGYDTAPSPGPIFSLVKSYVPDPMIVKRTKNLESEGPSRSS